MEFLRRLTSRKSESTGPQTEDISIDVDMSSESTLATPTIVIENEKVEKGVNSSVEVDTDAPLILETVGAPPTPAETDADIVFPKASLLEECDISLSFLEENTAASTGDENYVEIMTDVDKEVLSSDAPDIGVGSDAVSTESSVDVNAEGDINVDLTDAVSPVADGSYGISVKIEKDILRDIVAQVPIDISGSYDVNVEFSKDIVIHLPEVPPDAKGDGPVEINIKQDVSYDIDIDKSEDRYPNELELLESDICADSNLEINKSKSIELHKDEDIGRDVEEKTKEAVNLETNVQTVIDETEIVIEEEEVVESAPIEISPAQTPEVVTTPIPALNVDNVDDVFKAGSDDDEDDYYDGTSTEDEDENEPLYSLGFTPSVSSPPVDEKKEDAVKLQSEVEETEIIVNEEDAVETMPSVELPEKETINHTGVIKKKKKRPMFWCSCTRPVRE